MKTGIVQPAALTLYKLRMVRKEVTRQSRAYQYHKRMKQRNDCCYFHLPGFHFLSEKLRCTSHHQSADKDCDNDKCIIVHPPYADTAEPSVYLHVQHLHHTGQGHRRIVHAIDGTVGSNRSRNAP